MTSEERYLDLLSIFHFVLGGLAALVSCAFLIHIALGIAFLVGSPGDGTPPAWVGGLLICGASAFMLAGWILAGCMIATGVKLRQRSAWTFCATVAGVECLLMPMGTVLGVLTLVLLMKEPVRAMFQTTAASRSGIHP